MEPLAAHVEAVAPGAAADADVASLGLAEDLRELFDLPGVVPPLARAVAGNNRSTNKVEVVRHARGLERTTITRTRQVLRLASEASSTPLVSAP
jgi:hypothetical protein